MLIMLKVRVKVKGKIFLRFIIYSFGKVRLKDLVSKEILSLFFYLESLLCI